jgi:dTDP-4-dehydrorhamnose 3,5-epimerase
MTIVKGELPDVYIAQPTVFRDSRGYFFESMNFEKIQEKTGMRDIIQINQSKSKKGVIRGLHFQKPPYTQTKLVQVIKGKVCDIIVDIRIDSPTFGQWTGMILDGTDKMQLFVPRGFAHGFITLTKDAIFQYVVDNVYAPEYDSGIRFDDKVLNIDWIMKYKLIVSDKDRALPIFNQHVFNTKAEYLQNPIIK